jgi:hypothetical protein
LAVPRRGRVEEAVGALGAVRGAAGGARARRRGMAVGVGEGVGWRSAGETVLIVGSSGRRIATASDTRRRSAGVVGVWHRRGGEDGGQLALLIGVMRARLLL